MTLDPFNQVVRHRAGKRLAADDDVDLAAGAREKQRCLSCRVAATHDHNRFAYTDLSFHLRRRVEDTDSLEIGSAVLVCMRCSEIERVEQGPTARLAQQRPTWNHHNGQVRQGYVELAQETSGGRVRLEVQPARG